MPYPQETTTMKTIRQSMSVVMDEVLETVQQVFNDLDDYTDKQAETISELEAEISDLKSRIAELEAQIANSAEQTE